MGAKKGAKSKKKNGPKGKKARAKAKLDQVWGEHVDQDARQASKVRKGKSRLGLSTTTTTSAAATKNKSSAALTSSSNAAAVSSTAIKSVLSNDKKRGHYSTGGSDGTSSDDDDEDDSDDETMGGMNGVGGNGGSLANLLNRIRHRPESGATFGTKMSAVFDSEDEEDSDDSEDDEDESSHSSSSSESKNDDQDMEDIDESEDDKSIEKKVTNGADKDSPNNINNATTTTTASEDPYEAHFSKPPLPQLDSLPTIATSTTSSTQQQLVPHTGNNRKVNTSSLLNSSMDIQMSGPLLDSWDECMNKHGGSSNSADGASSAKLKKKQSKSSTSEVGKQVKKTWEEFAHGPYQHMRQVLTRNWKSVNKGALKRNSKRGSMADDTGVDVDEGDENGKLFSSLQLSLYPAIARYADVMISAETRQNCDEISNLLSMHVVNHVLTSRTRVQRHNRRIKELTTATAGSENSNTDLIDEGDDKWRDQGYTRPKVLILFPTRGTCWKFVKQMINLLGDAAIVDNADRFDQEYGPPPSEDGGSDEEDDGAKSRRAAVIKSKGQEWNELFGDDVNDDDDFKMGMSLTPNVVKSASKNGKKGKKGGGKTQNAAGASGVSVKLFAEFYRSDIILASPIGLKMATTNDEEDDDDDDTPTDVDFLSSIDICLVARSDVLLMQNWDHVNGVLECLNQQPKQITDIDFSRVRNYFLEGQGAHWRQLIVVSKFADPYILSTFRRHGKNVEGQLKLRRKVSTDDAGICNVMVRVKQVFQRIACQSVAEVGSARLRYFSDHVLPKVMRLKQKHTLIYIPSYFDFVAVRNLLLKREADFVSITEYARVSEVTRGRARFLQGRKDIMLYTGRAHFFLRHKIKGARHLIFYGLPEYAEFYPSVVNMLNEGLSDIEDDEVSRMPMSCLSLFTKFDAHQLERIVGTAHCDRMVRGEKSSYMFCS